MFWKNSIVGVFTLVTLQEFRVQLRLLLVLCLQGKVTRGVTKDTE